MEVSEFLSIIATLIAILTLILTEIRRVTLNAKNLEGRLVTIEQHQFLEEDRSCLKELELKMKLLWSIIEKEFPKLLKDPTTPYLDDLLDKVMQVGLAGLTEEQLNNLLDELENEYDLAVKTKNSGRAMMISFLKGSAELIHSGFKNTCKSLVIKHESST